MNLLKDLFVTKTVETVGNLVKSSVANRINSAYKKFMHRNKYLVTVSYTKDVYRLLKEVMCQQQGISNMVDFSHFRRTYTEGSFEFAPRSVTVNHEGKEIILSEIFICTTDKDGNSTKKETSSINITSKESIKHIESYLCSLARDHYLSKDTARCVYTFDKESKQHLGNFYSREVLKPILAEGRLTEILNDAKNFLKNKKIYRSKNIPFRRGYLLHGLPGTGKTSVAQYLAAKLNRDINVISSASLMECSNIQKLISRVSSESIVLIDDVDCIYNQREACDADMPKFNDFLAAFDSLIAPKGVIMILTANHVEKLDKALLRAGRIDRDWKFENCDLYQYKEFLKIFFPDQQFEEEKFIPYINKISPALFQEFLLRSETYEDLLTNLLQTVS